MNTENGRAQQADRVPVNGVVADALDLPVDVKVTGEYMKAFLTAYSVFKDDPSIPEQKRNIANYQVEFRQHEGLVYVLFHANRRPDEIELDGGESALGKDVIFTISRKEFTVVDKKFYK